MYEDIYYNIVLIIGEFRCAATRDMKKKKKNTGENV